MVQELQQKTSKLRRNQHQMKTLYTNTSGMVTVLHAIRAKALALRIILQSMNGKEADQYLGMVMDFYNKGN